MLEKTRKKLNTNARSARRGSLSTLHSLSPFLGLSPPAGRGNIPINRGEALLWKAPKQENFAAAKVNRARERERETTAVVPSLGRNSFPPLFPPLINSLSKGVFHTCRQKYIVLLRAHFGGWFQCSRAGGCQIGLRFGRVPTRKKREKAADGRTASHLTYNCCHNTVYYSTFLLLRHCWLWWCGFQARRMLVTAQQRPPFQSLPPPPPRLPLQPTFLYPVTRGEWRKMTTRRRSQKKGG